MILGILGAIGGVAVFLGAAWAVVRAVFHQSSAVKDNTRALVENTRAIEKLDAKVDSHDIRITRVEAVLDVRPKQ